MKFLLLTFIFLSTSLFASSSHEGPEPKAPKGQHQVSWTPYQNYLVIRVWLFLVREEMSPRQYNQATKDAYEVHRKTNYLESSNPLIAEIGMVTGTPFLHGGMFCSVLQALKSSSLHPSLRFLSPLICGLVAEAFLETVLQKRLRVRRDYQTDLGGEHNTRTNSVDIFPETDNWEP